MHRKKTGHYRSRQNRENRKDVFSADEFRNHAEPNKKERPHQKTELGVKREHARALADHVRSAGHVSQSDPKY